VVVILGVLAAATIVFGPRTLIATRADSTMKQLEASLRNARERALSERRNVEVQFNAANEVVILRRDVAGVVEVGTTELSRVTLEGPLTYRLTPGVPNTPDAFNLAASAIDFPNALSLLFTSEGTFVDQTGDPVNGTVFLGEPSDPTSARAITVFGPTALIRTWRWSGTRWDD
jgi:hypothetical protein